MPLTLSPEQRDMLALSLVPGLGPRLTAALIGHFGSPAEVLQASAAELRQVAHIGEKLSIQFSQRLETLDIDAECELLDQHATNVMFLGAPEYPERLKQIPDPPHLLYHRGTLSPADHSAVAVVGSRHMTAYGRRMTQQLAAGLVRAGYTIVSGLARGIDSAAHRAALDAGGRTIAVLAGGLSKIYPPEHADLAGEIEGKGALLSEAPMAVAPQPGMFHTRNRIISGLSRAVVIVEAGGQSGALITARHASDQGREVFVIPGPADSPASAGCHQLIRKGARLVRHVDDILEDLAGIQAAEAPAEDATLFPVEAPRPPTAVEPPGLDEAGQKIWHAMSEAPRHVDALAQAAGLDSAEIIRTLMMLEIKKVIRRLPGSYYERR